MKKILAVGIIFLFISVAVAPSINLTVVKASQDNDLVEVATQACGIQGYGDTTVKLTREQTNELDQLFESIDSKLNNATSREESIRIYQNAIIELDKYGLLPQGMTIEQAQHLITGWNQNHNQRVLNRQQEFFPKFINVFCLLSGNATINPDEYYSLVLPINPLAIIGIILSEIVGRTPNYLAQLLSELSFSIFVISLYNPFKLMTVVLIGNCFTNFHSNGLKGAVYSNDVTLLLGYTGLMFWSPFKKSYFLGFSLAVA